MRKFGSVLISKFVRHDALAVKSLPTATPFSRPILTPLVYTFDRPRRDPRAQRSQQRAHDLLDRALLLKIGATYLPDLVHANHPHQPFPADEGQRKGR